ncbi:virulence factor TspB C-terminal domain-related protein [Acinetobacter johnsonii]|uniref:virulence factor TspB C-terminal domain-related protein n=1 Tax=Acinetobacter johnsonii TaxID=40214 RepID=UPI0012508431|nr:virulence factor TspB C-terminal domain-related protein [Acinetobacter johnsonii]
MKAFKYLVFPLFFFSPLTFAGYTAGVGDHSSPQAACTAVYGSNVIFESDNHSAGPDGSTYVGICRRKTTLVILNAVYSTQQKCEANTMPFSVKVPVDSGKMVCISGCQVSISKCVDVDFEAGMTCDGYYEGRECGTPPPTTTPTTPPVTQDPTNPTDKTDEQKTFENIMHVIGEKLDGIKDAITGGNQNQDGGDTGGSTGGNTGSEVNVNVDMSETNAKIDETNSLIDELTKWLQGEDLGDDIFGDSEPPEKELTPQQFDTSIFSGRSQCPADARLSFNLLGGKTFTKTFEFKDWCDNLEIFGSLILIASYLFAAYIIVSKS